MTIGNRDTRQPGFFCLFLFLFSVHVALSSSIEPAAPKRILVIYETQQATPGLLEMEHSLKSVLQGGSPQPPEIYRESLDIGQFPELREQSMAWIRTKYSQRPVDLVIYFGNSPSTLFPGVPVIYCGDRWLLERTIVERGTRDLILPLSIDISSTLERISRLHPDARKLLLVAATGDEANREAILQQILTFKSALQFEDLSSLSVQQLGQRLARENEKTLVLYMVYSRGPKGEQYLSHDVIAGIAAVSRAPIYGTSDTDIGTGIIGGYVVNWALLGDRIGKEALRILQGEPPLQETSNRWQQWIFDWRQLQRWHIDPQEIPAGAVVLFRSPSFWEQHRWQVVGISGIVILQLVLIFVLFLYRYRQRKTEKKLRTLAEELLAMQEQERRDIAGSLQEHTERDLSKISQSLQRLLVHDGMGWTEKRLVQEADAISRRVLEEIRIISYLLNPPVLGQRSLFSALQGYLSDLEKCTSVTIHAELSETGPLSLDLEEILFRIAQESLAQAIRQSHADTVVVRLERKAGYVHLTVEANGLGMHAEADWASKSKVVVGAVITGLQERVSQLGGDFQVQASSTGTLIRVTMPVDSE